MKSSTYTLSISSGSFNFCHGLSWLHYVSQTQTRKAGKPFRDYNMMHVSLHNELIPL